MKMVLGILMGLQACGAMFGDMGEMKLLKL
jgi:hypothetical protein